MGYPEKMFWKIFGKIGYLFVNNIIMGQQIILSENEKLNIQKMYGLINEQDGTSKNPLCNSKTGTGGSGTETDYNVCVWKDQFATYIKLTEKQTGKIIAQSNGSDFTNTYKSFVKKLDQKLSDKTIGKELPIPINPDNQ